MPVDMQKILDLAGPIPFSNIEDSKVVVENFCSKDIAVVSTNRNTNISHGTHVHDSFEFTICHTDIPSIVVDSRIQDGPKGALIAFNPMQEHGLLQDVEGFNLSGIHIEKSIVQKVAEEIYGSPNIVFSNDIFMVSHDINLLTGLFLEELRFKQTGQEFMAENLALLIIGSLIRSIRHNLSPKPHNKPKGYKENLKTVIDYMNENYAAGVSCSELSKLIKMDKYGFIRAFKKQTNKTPYEYLLDLKIEKAKKMLKDGKYSITEISMLCGFSSHSHFTTTFRKKIGISPTEYKLGL